MENQPLISPQPRFRLEPIPENPESVVAAASSLTIPHSISTTSFFQEIVQHHHDLGESQHDDTDPDSYFNNPRPLHRCRTAPAMVIINKDLITQTQSTKKPSPIPKSIIKQAIFLLIIYLTLGVSVYSFNRDHYSGIETHPVVDALYFCIVTMCTIGYGDIAPLTPWTKIFAVVFVLFGFGFLDILLSGVVNYVLDLQESMILTGIQMGSTRHHHHHRFSAKDYIIDFEKGRMRIRMKVSLAVARAFLYLAEARIDRRHRRAVKSALKREITVADLLTPDTYQHGFISKSEYIVLKLKEMGKISDKDINQVVNQFDKLDPNNLGKITLPDLLGGIF